MRELGNEFSKEYRNVGNYIHRHPFFEEYILSQFQADACEPAKKDRNAPNSLPVETLEFFRAYFALAFSDKYRKMLRLNRDIPVEAAEELWTELCHTLAESVQAISEAQKSDREPVENEAVNRAVAESERVISEIIKFTRVLFGNPYFNQAAVSNFREEELSKRYDMLKAALKKAPAELQINVILDCMLCLDRNIVYLGQHTDPLPEKSLKDMLVSVLKTLCQYRNVARNGKYCHYRLENIKVGREDTGTLKEAFGAIPKPSSDRNLLNETRIAYMKHLNTMHEATGLEKEYRKLRDYLSLSSVETDERSLGSSSGNATGRCCLLWWTACMWSRM